MLKAFSRLGSFWPRTAQRASAETSPAQAEQWQDDVLPWLAGAVEWSERYGTLIAEARRWRLCAFAALGLAAVAVLGALSLAREAKVVPYIVQVDKHGFTVPIQPAERSVASDERNIRSAVGHWVTELRTVIDHPAAQYDLVQKAYAKMAKGSRAWNKANTWMAANNPLDRIGSKRIEVDAVHVYMRPNAKQELVVDWVERDLKQVTVVEKHFEAYVSIEIAPPVKEEDVIANPSGVFISDYTINQI
ncbi:MAG: Conjugal transfer protein [Myxococcaceae bacterium]|nr:Conjugal transfer protein [Myxococcaceae bacterium]